MIRYSYVDASVKEADVHTKEIFERELQLAKDFVTEHLSANGENIANCPMSGELRETVFLKKWNQSYSYCPRTWNLSLSNLPDEKIRHDYFFNSELSEFRASQDYQQARMAARKGLWAQQMDWIGGRLSRYGFTENVGLLDWGGRSTTWVDSLSSLNQVSEVGCTETHAPLSDKDLQANCQVISMIDVLQRESNPASLLKKAYQKLEPGGLLLLTCRNGAGFDIMTMRDFSRTIFPLDHICLPSPKGLASLLGACGFEVLELGTPGLFDVDIVKGDQDLIPKDQVFQKYLFDVADQNELERLQSFLQQNNLSSHMRAVAKKPGASS
ncbi:MAG: methyltransferase domain-containing protein [Pseudomonadota bacterium]